MMSATPLPSWTLSQIVLANPRGFCAGVDRAIDIVDAALLKFGAPIYVKHEIVHNTHVVKDFVSRGVKFIESLDEVPSGAILVFSAHGVSQEVQMQAKAKGFHIFDATCPLVSKVHVEVKKMAQQGYQFLMIGHKGHPEVEGTIGQLPQGSMHLIETEKDVEALNFPAHQALAVVTQTTLSVDDTAYLLQAIRKRFPQIQEPKQQDICYATQNRQDAVKSLASQVDLLLVIGSITSSNTNRLRELAERLGTLTYQIDSADDLQEKWFASVGKKNLCVGITAGASAPDLLVQQLIARLQKWGDPPVKTLAGIEENIHFPLPKGLRIERKSDN